MINQLSSAVEFLNECEEVLLQKETQNNLILGLADAFAKKKREGNGELYFSIEENGKVVGGALRTDIERPLSLSQVSKESCEKLVEYFVNENIDIGGVVGEIQTINTFAKTYSEKNQKNITEVMHQGVYQLDDLVLPESKNCKHRRALHSDLEVVKSHIKGFMQDCFPTEPTEDQKIEMMAKRHIDHGVLFLLEDDKKQIVSMACNNRETKNSGCVSLVYTPNEYRKNGYGALITALVSKEVLESGKEFCNLFTDLTNPTSNKIYQTIGYYKIGESRHLSFVR